MTFVYLTKLEFVCGGGTGESVVDKSVINGDVLPSDDLDRFLRGTPTYESTD